MLASRMPFTENASRAKTVLICGICVKKISAFSAASAVKPFDQKYQIMQNKPNFQNAGNALTLVNIRNYNEL